MKNRWVTRGVPMACPMCTAAYPCRFSAKNGVTMPLDMPLTINTNIQYNLDKSRFPGLDSDNKELTLMIAPVSVVATQTSTQCPAQTLVSTPLPSEDMQCSSGYVSEEDVICLDDKGLDTPGIVSLIESIREDQNDVLTPSEEADNHRRVTSKQVLAGHTQLPPSNPCMRLGNFDSSVQPQGKLTHHPSSAEKKGCLFMGGLPQGQLPWGFPQKPSEKQATCGKLSDAPFTGSKSMFGHNGLCSQGYSQQNVFAKRPSAFGGVNHHSQATFGQSGQLRSNGFNYSGQGIPEWIQNLYSNPSSMQTGMKKSKLNQRRQCNQKNWGTSISNPIFV